MFRNRKKVEEYVSSNVSKWPSEPFEIFENLVEAIMKLGLAHGIYNFVLTPDDLEALNQGKVIGVGDEYNVFIRKELDV